MTVYYSVGTLSPTFISWNDKNVYFGVESEIDNKKIKKITKNSLYTKHKTIMIIYIEYELRR